MEIAKTFESSQDWLQQILSLRGPTAILTFEPALALFDKTTESELQKGLHIATILLDLKLDNETVCAALLYPLLQTENISLDSLLEQFGESYRKLLYDVLQMQSLGKLQKLQQSGSHIENLRKLLLAMVTDVRAILIILAERLWLLRNAKKLEIDAQLLLARETFEIYAPLANRLGVWQLKWEIEDLCLRYMEPETYAKIAKWLASRRVEREAHLVQCINIITGILQEQQIKEFQITGRVKHIYSIYKKMQRKNADFSEIYDISAVRILVPEIVDCYTVLSLLQNKWEQIHAEFDDYISHPKPNGYQSIHAVVIGPESKNLEVQIRTYKMHHESELGVAAHWRYKEGVLQTSNYEAKIALLRQVIEWQKEVTQPDNPLQEKNVQALFEDHVYVFTPAGDIVDLPKGATPLDFAYHIHSEVGHRCRGAKVNSKMVPLTYVLQTGEKVEILTAKHARPSRDWLHASYGYLATPRARAKVQHWFRVNDQTEIEEEAPTQTPVKELPKPAKTPAVHQNANSSIPSIELLGINNLLTHVAKCCKPLPGNMIIGYITHNHGVSIHLQNCPNVMEMIRANSNRVLNVGWGSQQLAKHLVEIEIMSIEGDELREKVNSVLSHEKISILSFEEKPHFMNANVYLLRVEVKDHQDLERAMTALKHLPHVTRVRRKK